MMFIRLSRAAAQWISSFHSVLFLLLCTAGLPVAQAAVNFDTGGLHTCALIEGGTVSCWGYNYYGQLGNNSKTDSTVPTPVYSVDGNGFSASTVSAGYYHTCALISDGTVKCWGYGSYGQLGNGGSSSSAVPVPVSGLSNAIDVSAGDYHTCALIDDGTVVCWGDGAYGRLGNGGTNNKYSPVPVIGLVDVTALSAGGDHSCAVTFSGTVYCWGGGSDGQLGNGYTSNSGVPVAVSGLSDAVAVSAGFSHTCALASDGTVYCWGKGSYGALGSGSPLGRNVAVAVPGLIATAISAGADHTCALTANATVYCWGKDYYGQLGNGATSDVQVPIPVVGLGKAVAVSAGSNHTCAQKDSGALVCWGAGNYGQLGTGSANSASKPALPVFQLIVADSLFVVEYFHAGLNNYFITANRAEAAGLDANPAGGWLRTGYSFKPGGNASVCRFYGSQSPGPNSHFYTVDPGECASLKALQASTPSTQPRWNFESNDFASTLPVAGVCAGGTTPVYRVYNNGSTRGVDSNHRITSSQTAVQQVLDKGWRNEGVVMCAPI